MIHQSYPFPSFNPANINLAHVALVDSPVDFLATGVIRRNVDVFAPLPRAPGGERDDFLGDRLSQADSFPLSLDLEAEALDNGRQIALLLLHTRQKVGRREHGDFRALLILHTGLEVWRVHDLPDSLVKDHDDGRGKLGRTEDPEPSPRVKASNAGFVDRRQVGKQLRTLLGRHRERAHLARLYVRHDRCDSHH